MTYLRPFLLTGRHTATPIVLLPFWGRILINIKHWPFIIFFFLKEHTSMVIMPIGNLRTILGPPHVKYWNFFFSPVIHYTSLTYHIPVLHAIILPNISYTILTYHIPAWHTICQPDIPYATLTWRVPVLHTIYQSDIPCNRTLPNIPYTILTYHY